MKAINKWGFELVNGFFMVVLCSMTLYPFLHILALSLNDAFDAQTGGISIFPRVVTFQNYIAVFVYDKLIGAFFMSVAKTVCGTLSVLICTSLVAFAITRRKYVFRKIIIYMFIISMFLGSSLIPLFMLYKSLHIYNTFLVYILPGLVNGFYLVLLRSSFSQIPIELEESVQIDGANDFQVLAHIVIPLATPVLATVALFAAVGQWNNWTDTLYFTSSEHLQTMQYVLMQIIRKTEAARMIKALTSSQVKQQAMQITPESVRMAITIVVTLPIVITYPFLQKYFVKGMMVGSLKG